MNKHITSWFSPSLGMEMPVAMYGYYGFALLMVPTAGADFLEYERFQMINALQPFINGGMIKVFSINSINKESWMNNNMAGEHKAIRHNQVYYNSPIHYLPNLTDNWYLDKIKASHHIHIYTGSGSFEDPDANKRFSQVLWDKGIWHDLQVWGHYVNHDWPTWLHMLPYILNHRF